MTSAPKKNNKLVAAQVLFTAKLYKQIQRHASQCGVSVPDLIKILIHDALKKKI